MLMLVTVMVLIPSGNKQLPDGDPLLLRHLTPVGPGWPLPYQGRIAQTMFVRNANMMENSHWSITITGQQIITKFCKFDKSTAALSCAKFYSDHLIETWLKVRRINHRIWIVIKKPLVKWAPEPAITYNLQTPMVQGWCRLSQVALTQNQWKIDYFINIGRGEIYCSKCIEMYFSKLCWLYKSTFFQLMTWYSQATNHYISEKSMMYHWIKLGYTRSKSRRSHGEPIITLSVDG